MTLRPRARRAPEGTPPRHRRHLLAGAATLLVAPLLSVAVLSLSGTSSAAGGTAAALMPAFFTQPSAVAAPTGAASNPTASPASLACYSAGGCTAVGSYQDTAGGVQALAVAETNGTWGQATEVQAPANAGGNPDAVLRAGSCVTGLDCTAVGSYENSSGDAEAMQATETSGNWSRATVVSLPSDAAPDPQASLDGVSCSNAGVCTAVGSYQNASGDTEALIAAASSGVFGTAVAVVPPANAASDPAAILTAVSCADAANCTAVGTYVDSSATAQAMVVREINGTWGSASELPVPANAATNPAAVTSAVACPNQMQCTAFGAYTDTAGERQAMYVTESGGTFTVAGEVAAPADAYTDPQAVVTSGSCPDATDCVLAGTYENLSARTEQFIAVEYGGHWSEAGVLPAPVDAAANPTVRSPAVSCPSLTTCGLVEGYTTSAGTLETAAAGEVAAPSFTAGSPASYTIVATGTPTPPLTASLGLPSGVSFTDEGDGFATLSGSPAATAAGSAAVTITANNGVGVASSQAFTVAVDAAPAFTNKDTTTFSVGTAGSFAFATTGYPAATYSETGALPAGVTLDAAGVLSGTASAGTGGTFPVVVTATNSTGTTTQDFTLTVAQAAQSITSPATVTFTVGTAGTFTFASTGGVPTPTYTETGTLPSGVSLTAAGVLSGDPASGSGGTYPITVSAVNGSGNPATQDFVLVVDESPAVTSATSATFTVGDAGSFSFAGSGLPAPTFSIQGNLPTGLVFVNGVLSGTPTPAAATSSSGASSATTTTAAGGAPASTTNYPITVTAKNSVGSVEQAFTIVVDQAPAFTSVPVATFVAGQANAVELAASGYPAPAFSAGPGLPAGVTLSAQGALSGVPAAGHGGQYVFTVTANNGVGVPATQLFTLDVESPSTITSGDLARFVIDRIDNFQVRSGGFPAASFTAAGTLPSGVSFVGGLFTGVPTDKASSATGTFGTLPPAVTSTPAPSATTTSVATTTTVPASTTTTTPATTPTTPPPVTGKVPTAYPFTVTAFNGIGQPATQTFEILLVKAPPHAAGTLHVFVATAPVRAVGGVAPSAVPLHVSCTAAKCAVGFHLYDPVVVTTMHKVTVNKVTVTEHTKRTVRRAIAAASFSTTREKGAVVDLSLNKTGKALLAAAARARHSVALILVERVAGTTRTFRIVVQPPAKKVVKSPAKKAPAHKATKAPAKKKA